MDGYPLAVVWRETVAVAAIHLGGRANPADALAAFVRIAGGRVVPQRTEGEEKHQPPLVVKDQGGIHEAALQAIHGDCLGGIQHVCVQVIPRHRAWGVEIQGVAAADHVGHGSLGILPAGHQLPLFPVVALYQIDAVIGRLLVIHA